MIEMTSKELHRISGWSPLDEANTATKAQAEKRPTKSLDEKRENLKIAGSLIAILLLIGLAGGVAS